ncbi:hypothetical protein A2U01_0119204, partial [Trifolium medium]|nr:hypothetical protein [Trifolium medium]
GGFEAVRDVGAGGSGVGLIRISIVGFLVLYDYHLLLEGSVFG